MLDRVDQFADFDPRRDYALTVTDGELTPRSARHAQPRTADDIAARPLSAGVRPAAPGGPAPRRQPLGWRSLRPLQEQAIEPVLDGEHALLGAPTAGGKTEAAIFPLLSRMVERALAGCRSCTSARCGRC